MLDGRIDLAVHSLKDLPTELPEGIAIAAVGEREDPSDALVGRGPIRWSELPPGATVATSSLRRRAQLLHARPDLRVSDIRGNVDTRLAKLDGERGVVRHPARHGRAAPARPGRPDRRAAAARGDAAGAGSGRAGGHGAGGRRRRDRGGAGRGAPRADARSRSARSGPFSGAWRAGARFRSPRSRYSTPTMTLRLHGRVISLGGEPHGGRAASPRRSATSQRRGAARARPWRSGSWARARRRSSPRCGRRRAPAVTEP